MGGGTCRGVGAVFTDLDDTLTTGGRLTAEAYSALWRLKRAGRKVVVVTGRPAGWADLIMRLWPVDGVVGENGACIYRLDGQGRASRWYAQDEATRRRNRRALDEVAGEILRMVPGLRLAADQPFRETDVAIDISEEVPDPDPTTMSSVRALLDARGLRYKVSSIHVNAWFGEHDKATTCMRYVRDVLGEDPASGSLLFVGDSPNDEPLFEAFALSVGVRNIERFAADLVHPPVFVTPSEGAAGFVELAEHLLCFDE
jgi:HAD superfamily hydrolase (TIGR01484 family)